MSKSRDAFRTISEVADWLGVQTHVLRFWESKFPQVKPVKRAGGRRYYRPADMQLLGGIRKLLHDDGLTIKGVRKILREEGIAHVAALSHGLDALAPGNEDAQSATLTQPAEPVAEPDLVEVRDDALDEIPAEIGEEQTDEALSEAPAEVPAPVAPEIEAPAEPEPALPAEPQEAELPLDLPEPAEAPEDTPEPAQEAEVAEPQSESPEQIESEPAPVEAEIAPSEDLPEDMSAEMDESAAQSGLLTRIARVEALEPETAAQMAVILKNLRDWSARVENNL